MAKKGLRPSQIGVILRDSHGVAQARHICSNQVLRILKMNGLAPEIPEDLYHFIKKAVAIRKHLERNRKDTDSKFRLIPEFIVLLDGTRAKLSFHQPGSTNPRLPLLSSLKYFLAMWWKH